MQLPHSIDRAELLKLLNWNSSMPVTSWTPINLVKSTDGRLIDTYLHQINYKTPYQSFAENPDYRQGVPITTYDPMINASKNYKFEHAKRNDNRFSQAIARKYFEAYKKETGNSSVTLTFLSGDKSSLNAALGLRTMFSRAFGSGINLNIRQVPANTYTFMRKNGDFDLTTYNFDEYGSNIDSYMTHLFFKDEIDLTKHKYNGFVDNPTGSWNFHQWYEEHQSELSSIKTSQFLIQSSDAGQEAMWNKVMSIIQIPPYAINPATNAIDKNLVLVSKLKDVWSSRDSVVNSEEKQFLFISMLERIIALSSPIVPILEVDINWVISRLGGVSDTYTYSLQYAYDVLNKPNPSLPGKESLNDR